MSQEWHARVNLFMFLYRLNVRDHRWFSRLPSGTYDASAITGYLNIRGKL